MNKLTQHWSPILKYFKMNDFFFLLLDIDKNIGDPIIIPSKYNAEMSIGTEERLEKLKSLARKIKMRPEPSINTLKVSPDIVIFQKFKIGDFLSVPVTVLNTYDVSKPVRVMMESTTTFSISHNSDVCSKIAPGMAHQFLVNFNAREVKEYCHSLTVETDHEIIEVLIVCIHPRPLLDIPDTIIMPTTPVKTVAERVLLIRNMGEVPAIFNLTTTSEFSVHPDRGILGPGKNIQLSLTFMTHALGDHTGRLQITYETTEILTVNLKANASEANITLEYTTIEIPNTYMTLKRRKFIKLFNNSSHMVYFKWKRYKNLLEAEPEYNMYKNAFKNMKELESSKWFGRVHQGIVDSQHTHEMIYDRIYEDEVRQYEMQDKFLYSDPNWAIHPTTGEVWPESSSIFILEFSPLNAQFYESILYLEVSGKSERIPLYVRGCGLGPSLELNLVELDANDIFLCAGHQYEVAVHNKGHIPGKIIYKPTPLSFGGFVSFSPESLFIKPGCYGAFVMKFSSRVQGKFIETIEFVIRESDEVLKFVFKGNIICPLLNFDVAEIDFGHVTLGYSTTKKINLINTTQVPIEYKVNIVQDGENSAITCKDYAAEIIKPVVYNPKEFTFNPVEDIVAPNSTLTGELTLLPNLEGAYSKRLYLIMWGTSKYSLSLPIRYKCLIPEIECKTKDIFMRGCFINYVYTRTVVLTNQNEHPGYFMFVPQEPDESEYNITYNPQVPGDFIDAYETKEVQLDISTTFVGQSSAQVYISIFGGKENVFICCIKCNGQGPVITVPDVMSFDEIRTLHAVTHDLEVINDSPVPATVHITQNKKTVFNLSENVLQLDPSEKKNIEVNVFLTEPGKFKDNLQFSAMNSETQYCALNVKGVGSSIFSEPELDGDFNLGYLLTYTTFSLPVKFVNMGKKMHKIIWSRNKQLKSFKEDPATLIPSIFSITPSSYDLAPGQSIDCVLAGSTQTPGMVEEDFYCHAQIEKKKDFGPVNSFILTANFVVPVLDLSKQEMKFRIDTTPERSNTFLHDELTVTNLSKLEITIIMNIDPPFYIIRDEEALSNVVITMADGASEIFMIEFTPISEAKRCTVSTGKLVFTYVNHPNKDWIPLVGEENFPTLEFEPKSIDFDCIPNFSSATQKMILKNISPLPVSYHWEWIRNDFNLNTLESNPINIGRPLIPEDPKYYPYSLPNIPQVIDIQQHSFLQIDHENPLHRRYELFLGNLPTMTALETQAPPMNIAIETIVKRAPEYFEKMQVYLYQLVQCYDDSIQHLNPLKQLPRIVTDPEYVREVLDLIPTYGYLAPYESQIVSFEFNPCPNTLIDAVAHCHIKGGATEIISVNGKSSDISFSIESNIIEFGRQLFCEMCEQSVSIKNTGYADLNVQAIMKNDKDLVDSNEKEISHYDIEIVNIDKDVQVTVKYFPGIAREFLHPFIIQVGYLEPYTMNIHGYAMPAQVFCSLPRPVLKDEDIIMLSYKAIGKFSEDNLRIVKSLTQIDMRYKEDLSVNIRDHLKEFYGFELISFNDVYPTDIDIQMATEREAVEELLKNDTELLSDHIAGKCSNAIPNIATFPYVIDFDFVVIDTVVHYTTTVLNYGPIKNEVKMVYLSKNLLKCGFNAYVSKSKLEVGESTDLVVIFNPSSSVFATVDTAVKDQIYLTVSHGQRVPIEVRAFVTLPYLSCQTDSVYFENVIMGYCVRQSIIIENKGYVQSNWSARIELDPHIKTRSQIFFLKINSGVLNPNESQLFDVYFQPCFAGRVKGSLIFAAQGNEDEIVVILKGIGLKPNLRFDRLNVEFSPTLPYTQDVNLVFSLENTSMFPIEFFFADFDEIIIVNERIINILGDFYKTNVLYLPEINPGETYPRAIFDFYNDIINKIGQKLWEEEMDKFRQEEESSLLITDSTQKSVVVTTSILSPAVSAKMSKIGSKVLKEKRSISSGSRLLRRRKTGGTSSASGAFFMGSQSQRRIPQMPSQFSFNDLLKRKTSIELEQSIKEEVQNCRDRQQISSVQLVYSDPIKQAFEDIKPDDSLEDDDPTKKGILIVFHGSPSTNYFHVAHKAGLALKLPVYTIDMLIFDAIISKESLAAIKIGELIADAYRLIASDTDLVEEPGSDDYDRLQKKIDLLLTGKTKRTPKPKPDDGKGKKGKGSKSSKKSSKSEKSGKSSKKSKETKESKPKVDKRPTFIGLPEDLLYEIVGTRLNSLTEGLIIPSLNSLFIKQPIKVLNCILLSVETLLYMHFILFSYTFQNFTDQQKNIQEEGEKHVDDVKKDRIQALLDMDDIGYDQISDEDLDFFRKEVLIPRKALTDQKQAAIKLRIEMRAKGIVIDKGKSKDKKDDKKKLESKASGKGKKDSKKDNKKSKDSKKSESKKSKGSKKSKDSKKSKGSKKAKPNPEEVERKKTMEASDALMGDILHTLEYWDREQCVLTKDLSLKRKVGKGKSKAGSVSGKKAVVVDKPPEIVEPKTEFDEDELKVAFALGVPVWFLDQSPSDRDPDLDTIVVDLLAGNPDLQDARDAIAESKIIKLITTTETFTVAQKTGFKKRNQNVSDIFSLFDVIQQPKDAPEYPEMSYSMTDKTVSQTLSSKFSLMKSTSSALKKVRVSGTESIFSAVKSLQSETIETEEEPLIIGPLTRRQVINPGEKLQFLVNFSPEECGRYDHTFTVELVSWPIRYSINCVGYCDIPKLKIDPSIMFQNNFESRLKMKSQYNSYLYDEKLFEFGPILISTYANNTRALEHSTDMILQNDSLLPCNVQLIFLDPIASNVFKLSQEQVFIESRQSEVVTVSAQPYVVGNTMGQLAILVSNNPKVEMVNFNCLGVDFEFYVEPNSLAFERTLLNQKVTKTITFYNESLIAVLWRILDTESVLQFFNVSLLKGTMSACSRQTIQISFVAEVIEDIPTVDMSLQILHVTSTLMIPLQVIKIELSAEVLNIDVDCPREVNFGEVKARMEHTNPIEILSRIKYNMDFTFSPVDKYPGMKEDDIYRSLFTVKPEQLTLVCNKPSKATITFNSNQCVEFKDVPIFKCVVIDPPSQNVMMSFVITASAKTQLSVYQLCPPSEVYFGHQMVGTEQIAQLTLVNLGKFEFNLKIMSLKQVLAEKAKKGKKDKKGKGKGKGKDKKSAKPDKSSKKSKSTKSKSGKSSKGKKDKGEKAKKLKPIKLAVGCFTVTSPTSDLDPQESTIITVTAKPKTIGLIEEIIVLFISECSVKDKNGIPVLLSIKGDTPSIDFTYIEDIFCEQYIVDSNVTDFNCPAQAGNHCYFVRKEETLYFSKTFINNTTKTRLKFQSTCAITTDLFAEILNKQAFSVEPGQCQLDAFESVYMDVSFTPDSLTSYSETLEVRYNASVGEPVRYHVELKGEGYVPELKIIEPLVDEISNTCLLIFNPVYVGKTSVKRIVLENIGTMDCQVIMEVIDKNDMFLFRVENEGDAKCITKRSAILTVQANTKSKCELEFVPTKDVKIEATISVYVINNPFDFYFIQVIAESFIEDILLENIPSLSSDENKSDFREVTSYTIDFGCAPLNALQKKIFKIRNNSILNIYRFEFPVIEKVVFIPSVGHLKPGASKDVVVTFLSREPINLLSEPLELILVQIEYIEPDWEPLSWDERQNITLWSNTSASADQSKSVSTFSQDGGSRRSSKARIKSNTGSNIKVRVKSSSREITSDLDTSSSSTYTRRKIDDIREPNYNILPESTKVISLVFSVNADYCNYEVDDENITMEDTLMFEKRSCTFTIKNTSMMPVFINWKISLNPESTKKLKELSCAAMMSRSAQSAKGPSKKTACAPGTKGHLTGHEHFGYDEDNFSRPSSSSRTDSTISQKSSESNILINAPFIVEPEIYKIAPDEMKTFKVIFKPIIAFNYLVYLKSAIPNLYPKTKPLNITVKAKSIMPLYHFDIAPTNYLTNERCGRKICRDTIDENTRIVEIEGIGLGINHTKSFHIMNPTGESFDFKWEASPINSKDIDLFNCLIPKGHVSRGKLGKCSFSFYPQKLGTFEGLFTFIIEKYNLKTDFLIVGKAKNPCVYFSVPHLKLQPTLLRMVTSNSLNLKNNEDLSLHFKFVAKTCYNNVRTDKIIVEPMDGNIGPKTEIPIKIWCTPASSGDINFNLKCEVERMSKPLVLTVSTSAFDVGPLLYQFLTTGKMELDHNIENSTTLASMIINQNDITKFIIKNDGKIGFYYKWVKLDKFVDDYINVIFKEDEGYVIAGEEQNMVVYLKPIRHINEKIVKLKFSILYGPDYKINFICTTAKSNYKFSFTEYNFGPCLLQSEKTDIYNCLLQFSHNEKVPLLLEYQDDHPEHLTIGFKAKEILPKTVQTIPIYFHPLEQGVFTTPLTFFVNSKPEIITIKSKGVAPELVLEDHDDRFVNFGAVLVGRTVSKTIKLVNRTPATVDVYFNLYELLPYFYRKKKVLKPEYDRPPPPPKPKVVVKEKKGKKGKKDKGSKKSSKGSKKDKKSKKSDSKKSKSSKKSKDSKASKKGSKKTKEKIIEEPPVPVETPEERRDRLIKASLMISPKQSLRLTTGAKGGFIITYSPTERLQSFHKKIFYQIQNKLEPLCVVQASCIASEYHLDRDKICFGSVVKGCESEAKFSLYNTGDIGGKYKWSIDRNKMPSDTKVSITPNQGYISPDTNISFVVKYQPNTVHCYVRVKMMCKIEKYNKSLDVTLTGSCTNTPPPTATVAFQCPVRSNMKKSVSIQNKTETRWKIHPQLTGNYFSVPNMIVIEPNSTTACEITYSPVVMLGPDLKHTGSVYFSQPDGFCSLYSLVGEVLPPVPADKIQKDIKCKTYFTEILKIENWLKMGQKFTVITENMKPYDTEKILYKLTGNTMIDVMGSSEKDYYWGIYVLNEGRLNFQVIFKNESTKEYLLYEIELSVTQGDPQEEINLICCVRQTVTHEIALENPLKTPVDYKLSCTAALLQFPPVVTVQPLTEERVTLTLYPLFIDEQEGVLTVECPELGKYLYKIILSAKDPIPEPPVYLRSCLGQSSTQKVQIYNFTEAKGEYKLRVVDGDDFMVRPESLTIDAGTNGLFEMTFVPINLGNFDGTLKVTSITAGEYTYPLRGVGELPKPQGPIKVSATMGASIIFKNPFIEEVLFEFLIESKVFFVQNTRETLQPLNATEIKLYMKMPEPEPPTINKYPFTGKLTIVCLEPTLANIKWVYYLQSE